MTKNGHLLIDFLSYKQKKWDSQKSIKDNGLFQSNFKRPRPLKPFQFNELIMYHTPQLRVASLLMTRLIKTLGPLIIIIILQHHDPESL